MRQMLATQRSNWGLPRGRCDRAHHGSIDVRIEEEEEEEEEEDRIAQQPLVFSYPINIRGTT
jgi:hypothetical protein